MLERTHNLAIPRACALLLAMLASMASSHATGNQPQPGPHAVMTDCLKGGDDHDQMVERLRTLYRSQKFDVLDPMLACLMRGSSRFASGRMGSSAVYWMFRRQMPAPGANLGEIQYIQAWRQQRPDSIFSEFANLRYKYAMAWNSRGSGYAQSVSDDRWKVFNQGLVDTERALLGASNDLRQTPIWQNLLFATVLDTKDSQSQPRVVFDEGVKRWPTYYDFYEVGLSRLLPRWGGSWERVDSFVDYWSEQLKASEGESLYARLYVSVITNAATANQTKINWPRMKRSLDDLIARYPDPVHKNMAASVACAYGDPVYYKSAFQRIPANELNPAAWIRGTDPGSCAK